MTSSPVPTSPAAVALISDAVILEDTTDARALWKGAPAMAHFFNGADASLSASTVLALGKPMVSPFITTAYYAAADNDNDYGAVVVIEAASGVTLDELVMRVVDSGDTAFPIDVAFRLAQWIIEAGRLSPAFVPTGAHLIVTWQGVLRQLPLFFVPAGEMRLMSPNEVRGHDEGSSRVRWENTLHRAGVVLYHLIAARAPFSAKVSRGVLMNNILTMRVPLLEAVSKTRGVDRRRAEVVDNLIALPDPRDLSSSIAQYACDPGECVRFLSTWLAQNYPDRRAADLAFWEDALMVLAGAASAPWRPMHPLSPVTSIKDAMRELQTRAKVIV